MVTAECGLVRFRGGESVGQFSETVSIMSDLASAVGIPIAICGLGLAYFEWRAASARDRREIREARVRDLEAQAKDRLDREYGTYDELDNKYVEFMYACAQHPGLDLGSVPLPFPRENASEADLRRERALFAVLISIFERAIVMFRSRATEQLAKDQLVGWRECIASYCTRPSFLEEWAAIGQQFDKRFQVEMDSIIAAQMGSGPTLAKTTAE